MMASTLISSTAVIDAPLPGGAEQRSASVGSESWKIAAGCAALARNTPRLGMAPRRPLRHSRHPIDAPGAHVVEQPRHLFGGAVPAEPADPLETALREILPQVGVGEHAVH